MPHLHHFMLVVFLAVPAPTLARVQAPPRPPGSEQVHVHPGLEEAERERAVRAHRAHPNRPMLPASAQQGGAAPTPASRR